MVGGGRYNVDPRVQSWKTGYGQAEKLNRFVLSFSNLLNSLSKLDKQKSLCGRFESTEINKLPDIFNV